MATAVLSTIPVHKEVALIDDQIKILDDELAALEKRRLEIEQEKEELNKSRIAALSRTAPINRMLPELLSSIFEYAVDGEDPLGTELPLTLVTISHLWRKVALETPRVWGRVVLKVEDESEARPMLRRAQAFLERGKVTPIDVFFDILQWGRNDDRQSMVKEMVDMLVGHIERCTRFIVRVREEDDVKAVLSTFPSRFPKTLAEFSLESRESVRLDMPVMPNLASLSLDDVGPRNGWTSEHLQHLKSISLRYFRPIQFDSFLTALESAKDNLEELHLSKCGFSFDSNTFMFFTTDRRPCFPRLRKIGITDINASDTDVLFDAIEAPALEHLFIGMENSRLRYFKFMDSDAGTSLRRCRVKKLEIEEAQIEGAETRALLVLLKAASHSLEDLSISGGELDSRFFHAMQVEPSMLPHLQFLSIKKLSEFTGRELLRIIRARQGRDGITPLSSICVERCRSYEHDVSDALKTMDIKFSFIPY